MSKVQKEYLKGLNEVQLKAVTHTDGPVLVVAGPGSGKTRVLTYRIAHLIEEGVPPWEILALTFTNKAAREMKERIEQVVGQRANNVWAGTFHSIFARILRFEAEKIGYPSNFTIYDTDDSKSLLNIIIKELNLDKKVYQVNNIRSRISSAKSNLIPPKLYIQDEVLMQEDRANRRPHFHKIYELYMSRCKRAGAMDFDDLLYQLYVLLYKNPDDVLDKYRARFRYVLVDEFQDTNYLQYAIIRKLVNYDKSPRNICAVGDDAQSIYGFRGATIQNILDYENDFKKFDIQIFKLEQNYRSTEHIVQAANEVITHNKNQIQKKIWSDKGAGQPIKVIKAQSDNEEGKRVTDALLEQKNRWHLSNSEIAILYRTNAQSRVFEEFLRRYNVPYRIFGGMSFYQRKEVKDLIAYLRLAVNPKDDEAFRRVINYPKRGLGKTTLEKIAALANTSERSMLTCASEVSVGARAQTALLGFKKMIHKATVKAAEEDAYQAAIYIARQSGLMDALKNDTTIEGLGRLENVNALLDGISEFVENDTLLEGEEVNTQEKTLAAYLQNIALITDADEDENETNYVTLMSVHAAKGLEFKSIFVVGLEENLFPSFMSIETEEGLDEERRLFYVAITRAEQFLTLSFANSRYHYGQIRYNEPSRFLEEISEHHLDDAAPLRGRSQPNFGRFEAKSAASNGGAKVSGNFKPIPKKSFRQPVIDPAKFNPSPSDQIREGMEILHLKFGKGKVTNIDGTREKRVATIHFEGIDNPQRRIMLKFAKLEIVKE